MFETIKKKVSKIYDKNKSINFYYSTSYYNGDYVSVYRQNKVTTDVTIPFVIYYILNNY